MEFRLLGPFEVVVDGVPLNLGGRQRRTLLAILTVRSGETVSTERLIDELWGESPPTAARKSVQAHVAHLRRSINVADEILAAAGDGYVLAPPSDAIDSRRFEERVAEARAQRKEDPAGVVDAFENALGLFRGAPLAGLADDAFTLRVEASRLQEMRLSVMEDRLDAMMAIGRDVQVATEAGRLVSEHPLRERLWGILMLAQYRTGRQAEALRSYARARQTLAEELGIEPSSELQRLEEQILAQDLEAGSVTSSDRIGQPVSAPVRNPYKGLRAFDEADAADFFGRDDLVRRLEERLTTRGSRRLTVLAGPSGAGKSSVVRAGLIPSLRERDLPVEVMVPGDDPMAALGRARAEATGGASDDMAGATRATIVVDQFEELFTMVDEVEDVDQFIDSLVDESGSISWIVTVRADFLDRLLSDPRLGSLIEDALVLVPPLREHEVRAAIIGPAERVGVAIEPDLTAALINDVRARSASLPLLQYSLTDTFERSDGATLRLGDYERSGGISGAIARRSEELFSALTASQQDLAHQLFLQMVTVSDDGEVARKRVERDVLLGLGPSESMSRIIERFGAIRFLTFDTDPDTGVPTVELAHEALISEWPRLAGWIEQALNDLRVSRRLRMAVAEWEGSGRDESFLLSGARLAEMEAWRDSTSLQPTPQEQALLTESRSVQDAAERGRRLQRRVVAGVLTLATAVAVVFAVLAQRAADEARNQARIAQEQTQRAEDEASRAEEQARVAMVRQLSAAATANLAVDAELSTLLALEAVNRSGESVLPEAEEALHRAVLADNLLASVPNGGNGLAHFSPSGEHFISQGEDPSTVRVWDVDTVRPVITLVGHEDEVLDAVYDRAGSRIASTSFDGTVRIWDAETGDTQTMLRMEGPGDPLIPVFSWDGAQVAVSRSDGAVVVFDLVSGDTQMLGPPPGTDFALNLDFSPDGSKLAVAPENEANTAHVWDLDTGELAVELVGHDWWVKDVGFTPDGSRLVTGSFDTTNRVWDTESWSTILVHTGHESSVWDIQITADGKRVASSGNNEAVYWDLETGETLHRIVGHDGIVDGVDIDRDGNVLLTGSMVDRTTRLWDVSDTGLGEVYAVEGTAQAFGGLAFSSDGTILATSGDDGRVVIREAQTGAEMSSFVAPGVVEAMAFHPEDVWLGLGGPWGVATYDFDSQRLTTVLDVWTFDIVFSESGALGVATERGAFVWSDPFGQSLVLRTEEPAFALAVDPFDELIVLSVDDQMLGKLEVRDLETGHVLASHTDNADQVTSIAFSPDGSLFVTGSLNAHADIWSAEDYGHRARLDPSIGQIFDVAVSPDGTRAMTVGDDETLRVINLDNGTVELTIPGMPFADLDLSSDGQYVAATGPVGPVLVYVLDVDRLKEIAIKRLTRWWSPSECTQYLDTGTCPQPPEGFTSLLPLGEDASR